VNARFALINIDRRKKRHPTNAILNRLPKQSHRTREVRRSIYGEVPIIAIKQVKIRKSVADPVVSPRI
jgi:hypothetical protein